MKAIACERFRIGRVRRAKVVSGRRNWSRIQSRSSIGLSRSRALVPYLWLYEVGNGLLVAARRQKITMEQ